MSALSSRTLSSPIGELYLVTSGEVVLGLNLSGFDEILASLDPDLQKLWLLRHEGFLS